MKKGKNRKKVAGLAAGLAVLALCAGTFAWTSYTEWTKNHMQSKGFEEERVTIIEDFKPAPVDPDPNNPDAQVEVDKNVHVLNASSTDSFVRISFEEMLAKLPSGSGDKTGFLTTKPASGDFPVIVKVDSFYSNGDLATGVTDITADLKIEDAGGSPVAITSVVPANAGKLRLLKNSEGAVQLVLEKELKGSDFPKNFNFKQKNEEVPYIKGTLQTDGTLKSTDTITVAQKVTGTLVKTPGTPDKYTVKTDSTPATVTQADKLLRFWSYGTGISASTEADWAGVNVNVTASPISGGNVTPAVITSKLNNSLTFTPGKIVTTLPSPTDPDDKKNVWYYNSADGYFYWCNSLKPSETTGSLIKSVLFPSYKQDKSFAMSSYDLWVGLEAIPASDVALKGAANGGKFDASPAAKKDGNKTWQSNGSGWGMSGGNVYAYFSQIATIK